MRISEVNYVMNSSSNWMHKVLSYGWLSKWCVYGPPTLQLHVNFFLGEGGGGVSSAYFSLKSGGIWCLLNWLASFSEEQQIFSNLLSLTLFTALQLKLAGSVMYTESWQVCTFFLVFMQWTFW
jgi:hypothetical protein